MRDRPTRRRPWWLWLCIPLAVVVAGCGGLIGLLFWLFAPPANPTNQPQVVHTFPGVWPDHLRYSPDGTLLAVGSNPVARHGKMPAGVAACYPAVATLTVFDLTTGATAFTATYPGWDRIVAVEFAPDGDRLLVSLHRPIVDDRKRVTDELVVYTVPGFREEYRGRPGADWRAELHVVSGPTMVFSSDWHSVAPHKLTAWSYPDLAHIADFPVRMDFPRGVTGAMGGVILVWGTDTDSVSVVERFDRGGTPLGRFDLSALAGTKKYLEAKLRIDPATGRVWVRTRESEQEFDPATGKPIGPVSPSPLAYPSPFFTGWATPDDTRFVVQESENKRGPIAYDSRPWYQRGIFLRVRNTTTGAERRWRVAGLGGGPAAVSPDGSRVAAAYDESENRGPVGVRVWVSP